MRADKLFELRHTIAMANHNVPLSLFHRHRLAEAKLTAQRKLARTEATARGIRREAEAADRRAQALALRREGATYAAIGRTLGVSQTRAKQIVDRAAWQASNPHRVQLPMRAANFLKLEGFLDLTEADAAAAVAKLTRREVLAHPNVGKGAVAALADWLALHGHTFSEDAVERRKRSNSPPYDNHLDEARTAHSATAFHR